MWDKLIETYQMKPVPRIIKEIQRKYQAVEMKEWISMLCYENKSDKESRKNWVVDMCSSQGMTEELLYELVVHPWSFPALSVHSQRVEMPDSFYWKVVMEQIELPILGIQKSVGRIWNRKTNEWATCFVGEEHTVWTLSSFFKDVDNIANMNAYLTVDFSNLPSHRNQSVYQVQNIQNGGDEGNWIRLTIQPFNTNRVKLLNPLNYKNTKIAAGKLIACLGYPMQWNMEKRESDRVIFNHGLKLDHKILSLGVVNESLGKGKWTMSCSVLKGFEGAPVLDIETLKVIGMVSCGKQKIFQQT